MSLISRLLIVSLMLAAGATTGMTNDRPNIVWIMSEDNSKHYLRHFDELGAPAPNIESMAEHGITFDRAFSNSPVCSVARTTLITSCYGPRIGTQFHRRSKLAHLPGDLKMFPAYLRKAGYHTSNRSKEDYNAVKDPSPWDESGRKASWQNRADPETPFFHVRTYADSHESRLHFPPKQMETPTETDPQSITLQSYFPDTPTFRYTRARYHDRMKVIDDLVGNVLEELRTAGQLERTFVFYFGDHGGVLPRSKGYVYESGLHVPLVIRVPQQFRTLAKREMGSRTQGFVEFVDFGPTVLALAGVKVPQGVDGRPFLGASVDPGEVDSRNETFGYADRFDEKYELVRTLRVGRWKYIRQFEGYLPDGLQNNYRYKMLAFEEWRQLHLAGKLNDIQSQFFNPKPAEMLFEIESDPDEVHNLAGQAAHQEKLVELRDRLMQRMRSMPDLSLYPESVLFDQAMDDPTQWGQDHAATISDLLGTANLALSPYAAVKDELRKRINDQDPWQRYWACTVASQFGNEASDLAAAVRDLLQDQEPLVATRAAEFLAKVDQEFDPWPTLQTALANATNDPEATSILNSAVFLQDFIGRQRKSSQGLQVGFKVGKNDQAARRLDYLKASAPN